MFEENPQFIAARALIRDASNVVTGQYAIVDNSIIDESGVPNPLLFFSEFDADAGGYSAYKEVEGGLEHTTFEMDLIPQNDRDGNGDLVICGYKGKGPLIQPALTVYGQQSGSFRAVPILTEKGKEYEESAAFEVRHIPDTKQAVITIISLTDGKLSYAVYDRGADIAEEVKGGNGLPLIEDDVYANPRDKNEIHITGPVYQLGSFGLMKIAVGEVIYRSDRKEVVESTVHSSDLSNLDDVSVARREADGTPQTEDIIRYDPDSNLYQFYTLERSDDPIQERRREGNYNRFVKPALLEHLGAPGSDRDAYTVVLLKTERRNGTTWAAGLYESVNEGRVPRGLVTSWPSEIDPVESPDAVRVVTLDMKGTFITDLDFLTYFDSDRSPSISGARLNVGKAGHVLIPTD